MLLFPVVQVPFWATASQGRKESKPREGSGLPVQVEAVAGPVEVSTQEGWECPGWALLCVCSREELSGPVQADLGLHCQRHQAGHAAAN